MKFGEQITKTLIQEWAQFYINYEELKDALAAALAKHRVAADAKKIKGLHFDLDASAWPRFHIIRATAVHPGTNEEVAFNVDLESGGIGEGEMIGMPREPIEKSFLNEHSMQDPPMNAFDSQALGGGSWAPAFSTFDGADGYSVHSGEGNAESNRSMDQLPVWGPGKAEQEGAPTDANSGPHLQSAPEVTAQNQPASPKAPSLHHHRRSIVSRGRNRRAPSPVPSAQPEPQGLDHMETMVSPSDISEHFESLINQVQQLDHEISDVLRSNMDRVTQFYRRESQLICGAAAVCVDAAKRFGEMHSSERAALRVSFRQVYYSLDKLQQFCDLNVIAVGKFLKKFDKNTHQSSLQVFEKQLESLPFSSVFEGKQSIQRLKGIMFDVYTEFITKGNKKAASEALYLKDRADKLQESQPTVFTVGMIGGCCMSLLALIISEFSQQEFPLSLTGLDNAGYVLAVTFAFMLLPILFSFNVMAWERNAVNYVFVFDLDPTNHWTGLEILRNNTTYLLVWLACCYAMLRTWADDVKCQGSPSLVNSWLWPYFIVPICFLLKLMFSVFDKRPPWILPAMKRLLLTPYYPVEFSEFWIADQLTSLGSTLFQFQFFWCYLGADSVAGACDEGLSLGFFGLAIVPLTWRLLQCLRRYHDMQNRYFFPHLVNAGKYSVGHLAVISSFLVSLAKHKQWSDDTLTAMWVIYFVFHAASTIYSGTWDMIMDSGILQVSWIEEKQEAPPLESVTTQSQADIGSPAFTENGSQDEESRSLETQTQEDTASPSSPSVKKISFSLRRNIMYGSMGYYYMFLVVNPLLRMTWIAQYFISKHVASAPWEYIVFAVLGILRRFIWNFFRMENEQLNNFEHYRTTRFAPVPTRMLDMDVETADEVYNRFKEKRVDKTADNHGVQSSDWSTLSRFFASLPEKEKKAILDQTAAGRKKFTGKNQYEGKSSFFSQLPEPVKAALLLTRIGRKTLKEYGSKMELRFTKGYHSKPKTRFGDSPGPNPLDKPSHSGPASEATSESPNHPTISLQPSARNTNEEPPRRTHDEGQALLPRATSMDLESVSEHRAGQT